MMQRAIVPMHELNRRIPEAGRIRLGEKGTRGEPKKLARFRFTSADKAAIDDIAKKYGGQPAPWPTAPTPGQWQVTITEERVAVTLPPDPLGDGPVYESWSGGGCQRRCDGVEVVTPASPDPQPCICDAQQRLECKPTTRLNVILRGIPFRGVWRLESHGWNAAQELPGMVDLVLAVQTAGLPVGELGVEERKTISGGQTKRFNVPVLTAPISIDELASGLGTVHALGTVPAPLELEAGDGRNVDGAGPGEPGGDAEAGTASAPDPADLVDGPDLLDRAADADADREIEDAEIVEEGPGADHPALGTQPPPPDPAPAPGPSSTLPAWLKRLHAMIGDLELPIPADAFRHALVTLVTNGRVSSSAQLTAIERAKAFDLLAELAAGDRRVVGVREDGTLRVSKRRER